MITTKKKKEIYIIEKTENLLRILSRRFFPFLKQALIYVFFFFNVWCCNSDLSWVHARNDLCCLI